MNTRHHQSDDPRPDPATSSMITPTGAFDRQGRLWIAWVKGDHVYVARSPDRGKTFDHPVQVTYDNEQIDANGEGRPKIAFGTKGEVFISWTRKGQEEYTGDIRFVRSTDDGRTFSAPRTINDDKHPTGHRFESLAVSPAGHIYLFWIDKRDRDWATAAGREYAGAALYFSLSSDGGATFLANRKIKDHVCECCRIAVAFDGSGLPVLVWRDVIDGSIRDHGLVRFTTTAEPGQPVRATRDGWVIDGCPHHGPSLAIDETGTYHLVWFTAEGPHGAGVFYARSSDRGVTFSAPMRVGSNEPLGHAVILADGTRLFIAWKESGIPAGTAIHVIQSSDAGRKWTQPAIVALTEGGSDHPFLLRSGKDLWLSWFTAKAGYQLVPVERIDSHQPQITLNESRGRSRETGSGPRLNSRRHVG
jgi:hypothetical protein